MIGITEGEGMDEYCGVVILENSKRSHLRSEERLTKREGKERGSYGQTGATRGHRDELIREESRSAMD